MDSRSWWSPAGASLPRSAPARRTTGPSSRPENPASTASPVLPARASRPRSRAASISCRSSRSARPNSESAWRRWSPRRRSRRLASAAKATSPARCSSPSLRSRSSGRTATCWRPAPAPTTRSDTTISCGRAHRAASMPFTNAACSLPWPSISPSASGPRARRFRCRPLAHRGRARSSSASKRSAVAKPRRRSASAPMVPSMRSA